MVRITMEDGGIIDIELNEEAAPITCENFKKLVGQGFYNGLTLDRKSTRLNSSHSTSSRMPSSA